MGGHPYQSWGHPLKLSRHMSHSFSGLLGKKGEVHPRQSSSLPFYQVVAANRVEINTATWLQRWIVHPLSLEDLRQAITVMRNCKFRSYVQWTISDWQQNRGLKRRKSQPTEINGVLIHLSILSTQTKDQGNALTEPLINRRKWIVDWIIKLAQLERGRVVWRFGTKNFHRKQQRRFKEFKFLKVKNHGEQTPTALTVSSWLF